MEKKQGRVQDGVSESRIDLRWFDVIDLVPFRIIKCDIIETHVARTKLVHEMTVHSAWTHFFRYSLMLFPIPKLIGASCAHACEWVFNIYADLDYLKG